MPVLKYYIYLLSFYWILCSFFFHFFFFFLFIADLQRPSKHSFSIRTHNILCHATYMNSKKHATITGHFVHLKVWRWRQERERANISIGWMAKVIQRLFPFRRCVCMCVSVCVYVSSYSLLSLNTDICWMLALCCLLRNIFNIFFLLFLVVFVILLYQLISEIHKCI